jgi:hypothetical protein
MMSSNSKGEQLADVWAITIDRHNPAGRRMIDRFSGARKPSLESVCILAEIVKQTRYLSNGTGAKLGGALCGPVCDRFEVLSQRFPIIFILG